MATCKGKKPKKKHTKSHFSVSWRRVGGGPRAPGERKREGCKNFRSKHSSMPSGAWPFVDRSGTLVVSDVVWVQHALHTFGGRRIELPPVGATAASPFVCKNVGGLPCIEGLHLQDCIAEGPHREMKAHILATICPDFAMNLRRW